MEFVDRAFSVAAPLRHRRMFVVEDSPEIASEVMNVARKYVGESLLYVGEFPKRSDVGEERYREFVAGLKGYRVKRLPFARVKEVLGRTYDALVIDGWENFPPKEIGILVETVRGPGAIVLLVPELEKWRKRKLFFHEQYVVTPPYSVSDCRDIYLSRVVKKLLELPGIYVVGPDGEVKKAPKEKKRRRKKEKIIVPKETIFPKELYKLCATQDQVDVLKALEERKEGEAIVLLADRGRGKSAILGIFLAGVMAERGGKVVVTAPEFSNAEEIFRFVRKGLETLGVKYRERKGLIKTKNGRIEFLKPLDARKESPDIMIVDEAAGIYVSILEELTEASDFPIFSTTTHGYEGTGRLFQYRFLPKLSARFRTKILRMKRPIRYGEEDPIERWLYDVFLLDAEPADIKEVKELEFRELDVRTLFLSDEKTLREFIGIYVYAHYRNNPKDIAILADAPNQRAFAVFSGSHVICSLQVAMEGGLGDEHIQRLREGEIIQGNIIPDLVLKYFDFRDFPRMQGLRIVRIAVHPNYQGQGIGSFALKELVNYAKGKYQWVGAVFGATAKLLRFWVKNGFIPIHISPKRNPESGEYPVMVIKPLDERVEEIARIMNFGMKLRLALELDNYYRHMDPEVALTLFSSGEKRSVPLELTEAEKRKLRGFLEGRLYYDALSEVLYKLVVNYFIGLQEPELEKKHKLFIIEKVLKKKTWRDAAAKFRKDPMKFARRIDRILTKIGRRWFDASTL